MFFSVLSLAFTSSECLKDKNPPGAGLELPASLASAKDWNKYWPMRF